MNERNYADAATLMDQAVPTIMTYYMRICDQLDEMHGNGYAKKNPELVASLVNSATQDMLGSSSGIAISRIADSLEGVMESGKIDQLVNAMETMAGIV